MALLDVRDLHVRMPLETGVLHAVRGISLSVDRGETLCVVGESGCGKSLTSLAIMGLLPCAAQRSASTLSFDGIDIATVDRRGMADLRGDRIVMIFQDPMTSLNPTYTIGDQLCEALRRHRRVSARDARDRAVHLLERVGISGAADRMRQYPHQLSGGLRQRVMIAMALMCGPELIIADEPTTALDVTIQAQILRLLRDLQTELGIAILLITHDLGVVARVADRVSVMYAGEIVEEGSVQAIFNSPVHPYTQALLRCIPIPGQTPRRAPLGSIPGIVPSLVGEFNGCGFASRCSYASGACMQAIRSLKVNEDHTCRCVLDPAAAAGRARSDSLQREETR